MQAIVAASLLLATASGFVSASAAQMPKITGQNLSDHTVDFPDVCNGSFCVIAIGFSHSSQSQVKAWTERARAGLKGTPNVAIYSIAVLEDAPRLVRGMAVHGMKSAVPNDQQDHFVVVYKGEAELKQMVRFEKPNDAYVVLLDRKGNISWTTHGAVTDEAYSELSHEVSR